VGNQISVEQLAYAMKLGNLGEQFVLKSEKAFSEIKAVAHERVDGGIYHAKRMERDDEARQMYQKQIGMRLSEGLYVLDIIREGIDNADPRISI
jgi:hypothetical protein